METASLTDYEDAIAVMEQYGDEPDPAAYGVWVPGIPVFVGNALEAVGAADWLAGLINDGIVAGVGAVLGFVLQMLVLFLLLAFLEACGYMARIAFVLDRIFRKFGLSGKSFIPMLIGTGCGIPGIMASRTIENERDRRMTIMTTTFIPCGAKVPFISMVAGYSFLVFNLLCAPCFAAIGAIKREMNNAKWTWFAIGYQCGLAYAVALMVYQIGLVFTGNLNVIGLLAAIVILSGMIYMLFRPYKEATKLTTNLIKKNF